MTFFRFTVMPYVAANMQASVKAETSTKLKPVKHCAIYYTVEDNVVTVFTSSNVLLFVPVNIGQTLCRLLSHSSMSKVSN